MVLISPSFISSYHFFSCFLFYIVLFCFASYYIFASLHPSFLEIFFIKYFLFYAIPFHFFVQLSLSLKTFRFLFFLFLSAIVCFDFVTQPPFIHFSFLLYIILFPFHFCVIFLPPPHLSLLFLFFSFNFSLFVLSFFIASRFFSVEIFLFLFLLLRISLCDFLLSSPVFSV